MEVARYWGLPERLEGAGGAVSPADLDERRDTAIVAVLTDGRELARAAASDPLGTRVAPLLRMLGRWPRLTFIDFGEGTVRPLLGWFGLEVAPPGDLVRVLGGEEGQARPAGAGDLRLWEAACALAPWPVDDASALWLRGRLSLSVPAIAIGQLRAGALPGGALRWTRARRAESLRWLLDAGTVDGALHPRAGLLRALAAWRERLGREEERRAAREADLPWRGTPAEHRLRLDRAALRLWTEPGQAARELYALWGGPLKPEVEEAVAWLVPADLAARAAEMDCAVLPWRLGALEDDAARVMLLEMGLGRDAGVRRREALRRPGRTAIAEGVCGGLGLGALGVAVVLLGLGTPPDPCPSLEEHDPESGITLVRVCGTGTWGTPFLMGSAEDDELAQGDEKPRHPVELSAFWIGRTEVTNAQYRRYRPDHEGEDELPVTNVSWHEARGYCRSIGLDLPTEAQWEYACRAGSTTRWSHGDDEAGLERHAWFGEGIEDAVHPVAQKEPNRWGLYDMHGNAWEWTSDCYDPGVYDRLSRTDEPVTDAIIDNDNCALRVARGGSYWRGAGDLRSAGRGGFLYGSGVMDTGFRCLRSARPQPWPSPP